MRIGLVAPPWLPVPPRAYGGTETVLDRLARGLVAAGHEVLLATTGDSTCPVPRTWSLPVSCFDRVGESAVELRHVLHAYDAMADCDVVHDHTVTGALVGEHPRIVTTYHGHWDEEHLAVFRAAATRASIVAISWAQAREGEVGGVPVRRVIHHGIDPEAFPVGAGDGGYVAFLGRAAPEKGMAEAARAAREAGVPLKLAAKIRHRQEREYFDAEVRPLLGGDVEFLGEVGGVDRLALLQGARALLNPISWAEPFGLVMIEALACGTPVITTREGAAPEIVDDGITGYLCATRHDLVVAIEHVGRIDRAACRETVEHRFSTRRMVDDHVRLYGDVLADETVSSAVR